LTLVTFSAIFMETWIVSLPLHPWPILKRKGETGERKRGKI
jgi:hypothetical protein